MKKSHLLSITLLLALLAFGQAGCNLPNGIFSGGTLSKANVIGLDYSLVDGAPPNSVEVDSEFQIIAEIENYGDIPSSTEFCVEDTADDIYGGVGKSCQQVFIKQASVEGNNILPAKEVVILPSSHSSFSYNGLNSQQTTIISTLHYQYSTQVTDVVICAKDPLKQTAVDCKTSETISGTIKAPLSIERIEKTLLRVSEDRVKLNLKLHLKKSSLGTLYLPGSVSKVSTDDANKVIISSVGFGPNILDCGLEDNILEIQTEKVLSCFGVINVNGVIEHPLNVRLDYAFEIQKKHNLLIEDFN